MDRETRKELSIWFYKPKGFTIYDFVYWFLLYKLTFKQWTGKRKKVPKKEKGGYRGEEKETFTVWV